MDRESVFSSSLAFFLSPIQRYLEDPSVTEVMVNGANEIYIDQAGQLRATGVWVDVNDHCGMMRLANA